ncbi:UDP-glucose 4-epimerase [Nakamurella panacisegetis]|uniref:UDP-glucose 4-epimerase n=1 Tax=Nakamurella panacisegetis TaxID=1090615 RepID=A0A1H0NQV7_9ACTN|nr:NAD-dependent epimerase/dehydratase family protein [Nakamurella panacisegetis]SDO95033.1 UDP-glucose 4-epimerase [Nakamurella panacisegetis]
MIGLTVLVTGVTRYIGSALAGRLAAHPGVDRVIGVDAALPEPAARLRMGGAEFARADIRNPLISRVIDAAGVDTVIHASASSTPSGSAARTMAKEMNVLGTIQLLAACQRAETLKNLIVRSTAAVYGGSSRDPAVATEETLARSVPSTGLARDAIDIEGYVRGFGRRRPDVRVAVPRFSEIIGPTVRTPLTKYFSMSPFVPMAAGHDARLQLVHESDAVALLEHLALGDFAGIVNVAGAGAMTVAQAIHRAGRLPLPIPSPALDGVGRAFRLLGVGGFGSFSAAQVRLLAAGRVLDTSRLRDVVGFDPEFSTTAAFDDFVGRLAPALDPRVVRQAEVAIASRLGVRPEPTGLWESEARPAGPESSSPDRPRLFSVGGDRSAAPPGRVDGRKR